MKLSDQTLAILKNFSSISSSIFIGKGSEIRTVDNANNASMFARAEIAESFPRDFAIYDLPSLLSAIVIFESPDIQFEENFLRISENDSSIQYFYTPESMVNRAPSRNPKFKGQQIPFKLTKDILGQTLKAGMVMSLPTITFRGVGNKIEIVARDKVNPSSNEHATTIVTDYEGAPFVADFDSSSFKLVGDDYEMTLCYFTDVKVAAFLSGSVVEYFMSGSASSKYEGEISND